VDRRSDNAASADVEIDPAKRHRDDDLWPKLRFALAQTQHTDEPYFAYTYKPSAGSMLWSRDDLTEYLLACACQSSHLHTALPPAAPGKPAEHRDCLPSFHHALILTTGSEAHIYDDENTF
jgi:hypothetical protein